LDQDGKVPSAQLPEISNELISLLNTIVPIGGIIAYFGDPGKLPDKWMACDGSMVQDAESPLNYLMLPDLREKFIRGESQNSRDITKNLVEGGADSHSVSPHSHKIEIAGNHKHGGRTGVDGVQHTHEYSGKTSIEDERTNRKKEGDVNTPNDYHTHTYNGTTLDASAHLHSHVISEDGSHDHGGSTDNTPLNTEPISHLPRYVAFHYIIRIK
jgi:hypothetical protein